MSLVRSSFVPLKLSSLSLRRRLLAVVRRVAGLHGKQVSQFMPTSLSNCVPLARSLSHTFRRRGRRRTDTLAVAAISTSCR